MTTGWGAPRGAYIFAALLAEGDDGAAAAEWKGLEAGERSDLVIALGAQAAHAAHLAGKRDGIGAVLVLRARQAAEVSLVLAAEPRIRDQALGALSGAEDAPAPDGSAPELWYAAVALATARLHTLYEAGISALHAALISRRAARR